MKFLKKFLLKLIFTKRSSWILSLFTVLFGTLIPLGVAYAGAFDWFIRKSTGALMVIPSLFIGLILQITLAGSIFFASISAKLLSWIIVDFPILIPLTKCPVGVTCIVDMGWQFSRNLANIFFILILVVIALAYILRLETFRMKKALPKLIIIALLVNFSQVFVGVIVDMTQIIMRTFTSILNFSTILNQMEGMGGGFIDVLKSAISFDPAKQIGSVVRIAVMVVFNLVLGFVFILYFFIFIARVIALWLLTILAPLAFLAYILPQTKGWWDAWLKMLLSWAFVGVFALFFLFFGFILLNIISVPPVISDTGYGTTDILNSTLPYIITIVFLFIGFMIAMSGAPAGAKAVIKGAQRGGKAASKRAGKLGWEKARNTATRRVRDTTTAMQRGFTARGGGWSGVRGAVREGFTDQGRWARRPVQQAMARAQAARGNVSLAYQLGGRTDAITVGAAEAWRATRDSTKGMRKAARDVGGTGLRAGFGMAQKGKKICRNSNCRRQIDKTDAYCRYCKQEQ